MVQDKFMKNTLFIIIAFICFVTGAVAQNWNEIQHSGKYYYGIGYGATYAEAREIALSELAGMIHTHVESDFKHLTDYTNTNGEIDNHHEHVQNYIKSCTQATLTNVETYSDDETSEGFVVRLFMARSEMEHVFESRIEKAKQLIRSAETLLEENKVDAALRDYYWAYILVQSVQFPNDVKDAAGNVLVVTLPEKIESILTDIDVYFEKRVNDEVYFIFAYKGNPVRQLLYSYNNGRDIATAFAKNGRGIAEMLSSHTGNVYHLNIEYEYLAQARKDNDLGDLLNVVTRKIIPGAYKAVRGNEPKVDNKEAVEPVEAVAVTLAETDSAVVSEAEQVQKTVAMNNAIKAVNDLQLKPKESQLAHNVGHYNNLMAKVVDAINARRYSDVAKLDNFTSNGLEVFNELVMFGSAHVVGVPKIDFFNGFDSCIVARGLQMSFSFTEGRKHSIVEDVVFYFDKDGKIDNISFGLGIEVTNEVLNRAGSAWNDEVREILLEFLENYKTAYSLKRLDYIRSIFADDAVIIVGKVVKKKSVNPADEKNISIEGQNIIEYNKLTKNQYLENLERVFMRNEFVHLNFSNLSMRKILKVKDADKFVIQLAQDYTSSRYADKGYLMLFVDITNRKEPFIEVRTWQPDAVNIDQVYHEGSFF